MTPESTIIALWVTWLASWGVSGDIAQSIISVRDCKFTPYLVNGKAVAYRGEVELVVP